MVTSLSLQLTAFISIIVIIVSIIGLLKIMKLIYHFCNVTGSILSTFAIIAITTNILSNIWLGILGNNSLFAFINNIYPFIDNHCLFSVKALLMMHPIYMSALHSFILMRMYYIFKSFPIKYSINIISYKITMTVSLITCCFLVLALSNGTRDTFQVKMLIAIDNNKHKQCIQPIFYHHAPPKIWGYQIFWQLLCFQLLVWIYILFLCITKLYQFNKYLNNGYIYNDFNMPYLHNHKMRKAKKIKNMLYLPITSTILGLFSLLIAKLSQYQLHELSRIIDTITIFYLVNDYFTEKIEAALQNQNNDINNNLSIHLFQDSNAFNQPFNNLNKPFMKNAIIIFETLKQLFCAEFVSQLIAEYASTLFLQCVECNKKFGFIECYNDYDIINGATAVIDENDKIRYYLNCDPSSWSQCLLNDNFVELEIFCIECGLKWKCNTCSFQALQETYSTLLVPDGCDICKLNVCNDCSMVMFAKDLTICDLCYNELSISKSSKSKQSPNQQWTNWNFDQSGFDS